MREENQLRKLIVWEFASIDGVMEAPGGEPGGDIFVAGSRTLVQTLTSMVLSTSTGSWSGRSQQRSAALLR